MRSLSLKHYATKCVVSRLLNPDDKYTLGSAVNEECAEMIDDYKVMMTNNFMQLVYRLPTKPWDWPSVAKNPNVEIEYLRIYDHKWLRSLEFFVPSSLSTFEIEKHTVYTFYESTCKKNRLITMQDMFYYDNRAIWELISMSHNITMDDVLKYPIHSWCWRRLSENPGISVESLLENHDKLPVSFCTLSRHPKLTIQHVLKFPSYHWNWSGLSQHANITMKDVLEHPKFPWVHRYLSNNPNVSLQDVLSHPEVEWDWDLLSQRIPFQEILAHLNLPWEGEWISANPSVHVKDVLTHPEVEWDWSMLAANINFTLDDILKLCPNPDWTALSLNRNLTYLDVLRNLDKSWNWRYLSMNLFDTPVLRKKYGLWDL